MSADNWAMCPKCKKDTKATKEKALVDAGRLYGKVSSDEFMSQVKNAESLPEEPKGETLREDYKIRINRDGEFYINYSCGCYACGFKHDFKKEENVLLKDKI